MITKLGLPCIIYVNGLGYILGSGWGKHPTPFSISCVFYGHGEFIFNKRIIESLIYWGVGWWSNYPTPCNQPIP